MAAILDFVAILSFWKQVWAIWVDLQYCDFNFPNKDLLILIVYKWCKQ